MHSPSLNVKLQPTEMGDCIGFPQSYRLQSRHLSKKTQIAFSLKSYSTKYIYKCVDTIPPWIFYFHICIWPVKCHLFQVIFLAHKSYIKFSQNISKFLQVISANPSKYQIINSTLIYHKLKLCEQHIKNSTVGVKWLAFMNKESWCTSL